MKIKPVMALMDEDKIVYIVADFIFKNTARYERIYPTGRITECDFSDLSILAEYYYPTLPIK